MEVAKKEPPVDGAVSTHDSFYSHQESAATDGEPEVVEQEEETVDANVIDVRGRWNKKDRSQDVDDDPEVESLQREVDNLKKELTNTRDQLQTHEKILGIIQNMDPHASVSSVADIISLGRKKEKGIQRKKQTKEERVAPVSTA